MENKEKDNNTLEVQRNQMAMDRLEVFLDDLPGLEASRKTWLRSLFATVMMMGNFSIALNLLEHPNGLHRTDDQAEEIPGHSAI